MSEAISGPDYRLGGERRLPPSSVGARPGLPLLASELDDEGGDAAPYHGD